MRDTIRVKFDLLLVMPIERKLLELFKFNPCQIKDEEILDLVKVKWTQYNSYLVFFMSKQFTNSLRCLKDQWSCGRYVTIKRGISQSRFLRLKLMLCMYIIIKGSFWKSKFFGSRIQKEKISKLIKDHEEYWCMKSHVVLLALGGENTSYFHKMENHEKSFKSIWKLKRTIIRRKVF